MADRTRKRLFSEKQIGSLIKRATELQEEKQESSDRGLSLDELEQMSTEMGIDRKYLRAAARELAENDLSGQKFHFWGGPFMVEEKRIVEGELTPEKWESVVRQLRSRTGSIGKTSESGSKKEWSRSISDAGSVLEKTQVSLRPLNDQTAIEVRKHYRGGALMAYFFGLFIGGMGAGLLVEGSGLSDLFQMLAVTAGGAGGLTAVRYSITAYTRRQRKRMKNLMNRISESIAPLLPKDRK